jgi:NADH-quinone oxidoreductase subunit G
MIRGRKQALKAHMGEGEAPVVRLPESGEEVNLTIDGVPVRVPKGTTILQAALSHGIKIPYFCFHPGLSPEGNCRMCLVQLEGRNSLEPSCILPVAEGMAVQTDTPAIVEARRGVMEFLLLNHPLDCPWCDKAGECMLQDNSLAHGRGEPRHELSKRTYPVKVFSERLKMYMNRCIHCTRCVRFLREVEGSEEFSLYERGAEVDVGTYLEHNLSGNYQGCLADVCPVGALVTRPFLYRARAFYLETFPSVCAACSTGCSIWVDRYRGRAARLRPRANLQVNDWWMCDVGRFGWERIETGRQLHPVLGQGEECHQPCWTAALTEAERRLKEDLRGGLGAIVAATATCEEAWLLGRLVRGLGGEVAVWYGPSGRIDPQQKGDFLHRLDPNPNTRGVEMVLGPTPGVDDLLDRIGRRELHDLIVLGADLDEPRRRALSGLRHLTVLTSHATATAALADLVLPGAVWLEKEGSFVNGDGHLQCFRPTLEPPGETHPEADVLASLAARTGGVPRLEGIGAIRRAMAAEVPFFARIDWEQIPSDGVRLEEEQP